MRLRRAILVALILCAAGPVAPRAEPAPRAVRLATLGSEPTPVWEVFDQRLRDLGYVEGRDLRLERRWTHGFTERVSQLTRELLALKPDVLVTSMLPPSIDSAAVPCAPILAIGVAEPYGRCPVFPVARKSLAAAAMELSATHLRLARALVPTGSRVVVVTNSGHSFLVEYVRAVERAAAAHGAPLGVIDAAGESDIAAALTRHAPAVVILAPAFGPPPLRKQLVQYATRRGIPAVGAHLADGVVVAADYDWIHLGRHAADLVDRLLRGVPPPDLARETALEFEVIVDRRAAAAAGLTLPEQLLTQADRVLD